MDTLMAMAQAAQDTHVSYTADIMSIATIVGMWKMFEKAGEPGWAALIPFYNVYKFCEIVMANPWWWLRLFVFVIPVIGWVAGLYFLYQMGIATARAYGKSDSWAWGYMFLAGIFYCITGFDSSEYYGPMGAGDNRTAQAKQARTVNFDVVKNEPVREYKEEIRETVVEPVTPAKKEEEVVDFHFDEPIE